MNERRNLGRLLKAIRRADCPDVHRGTGIIGDIEQIYRRRDETFSFTQHRPKLWECIGAHFYTYDAFASFKHLLHGIIG